MTASANDLHPTRDDFIDARNKQDQQLNHEFASIRSCIEATSQRLEDVYSGLTKDILRLRTELETFIHRDFDASLDWRFGDLDAKLDIKLDRRFQDDRVEMESRFEALHADIERQRAVSRNNNLRNPTMRIEPVVTLRPGRGVVAPDERCFPRHAKQFYALRRPDTALRVRMLSYLIDFYDVEYAAWQVVDEDEDHDEFDYESYEDEEENDGGSAGPPPPSQPRLTLRDAVQTYPERAVAALEGILGLNEENFINFRDRARQQASSPRRPVKRQYHVPDRTDERGQSAPAKRVPKPIQGKAERAPLPLVQNRLTLEEVLDGIDEENDKEKSTSTRVMWDDGSGRRRRMQKMQQLAERGARSSEGSPTNADTLSREEARSRRRTPSDPLDLRS